MEIVRAHDLPSDIPNSGLDLALGLDRGDRERGDEWEGAEDDESDECRGMHARGDLGSPMVQDGFAILRLAALEVMVEPTATDDVEGSDGGPVGEVDDDAVSSVVDDVGGELGVEGRGDVPYVVVHVADVFEGKGRRDDAAHPAML